MKRFLLCFLAIFTLSSCIASAYADFKFPWEEEVTMPYSTQEYREMGWSVEELVSHFEELGFSEIKIDLTETFDETRVGNYLVNIEDSSRDSWITEYRKFEKGETFRTYLKMRISGYKLVPTLTVDNCEEFAELVAMNNDDPDKSERLASFMHAHNGEYLEFDGTITNWYDDLFYIIGVDFTVAIENSDQTRLSWGDFSLSKFDVFGKYHYDKYYVGKISEGMKIHIIAKINYTENMWSTEIASIEIIE